MSNNLSITKSREHEVEQEGSQTKPGVISHKIFQ